MNSEMENQEIKLDENREILSWLPIESLLRFKCVCRQWHGLIQQLNFIEKHMKRAAPRLAPHDRDVDDERFRYVDNTAGLVLELNVTTLRYYIRNPALRQILALPNLQSISHTVFMAVDFSTGECKLLSAHFGAWKGSNNISWEILSVGRDDDQQPAAWRALQITSACVLGEQDNQRPEQTDWGIHFKKVVMNDQQDLEFKIVSFDLFRENFEHNTLPSGLLSGDLSKYFMFPRDKSVCVGEITGEELHFVELKREADKYRWSDSMIVVPLRSLKDNDYTKERLKPLRATSDDLWFRCQRPWTTVCCDIKTGRFKERRDHLDDQFRYQPSLLALRGMTPYNEDN